MSTRLIDKDPRTIISFSPWEMEMKTAFWDECKRQYISPQARIKQLMAEEVKRRSED